MTAIREKDELLKTNQDEVEEKHQVEIQVWWKFAFRLILVKI